MQSGYKIEWSDEALTNLDSIIDYLLIKWTDREIRNFYKQLDKRLEIISANPYGFPASEIKYNIRRSVLTEQTTIFYEIKINRIVILSLFDNRKDPGSIII